MQWGAEIVSRITYQSEKCGHITQQRNNTKGGQSSWLSESSSPT